MTVRVAPWQPVEAPADDLDERQRRDLVFSVGSHGLTALAFNTFGVVPEQEN